MLACDLILAVFGLDVRNLVSGYFLEPTHQFPEGLVLEVLTVVEARLDVTEVSLDHLLVVFEQKIHARVEELALHSKTAIRVRVGVRVLVRILVRFRALEHRDLLPWFAVDIPRFRSRQFLARGRPESLTRRV